MLQNYILIILWSNFPFQEYRSSDATEVFIFQLRRSPSTIEINCVHKMHFVISVRDIFSNAKTSMMPLQVYSSSEIILENMTLFFLNFKQLVNILYEL